MEPFVQHRGRTLNFDRANTDTDAIIPARYLKRIERTGYGEFLFQDLKQKDGTPLPEFPLNRPENQGATVLVARQNFGCGSSREHAVWAITQWGFRAVLAPGIGTTPGFADIFRNNSYKNGLLPVQVSEGFINRLFAAGQVEVSIDLPNRRVTAHLPEGDVTEVFPVPEGAQRMLVEGLDEIGLTLRHADAISRYEAAHPEVAPTAA